jgi:integrase/recombinase XerD
LVRKITDFSNFLKFEKSFSDNTLDAYIRDIKKLENFAINDLGEVSPQNITYQNLQEFIYQLSKKKISERSQARGISSIKAFFKFLLEEEYRDDNPATLLEGPKLGLYLPDTLSEEDINRIINCIDSNTDTGKETNVSWKCFTVVVCAYLSWLT